MMSATPCLDELDRLVAYCRSAARRSAGRCKPTMWAYYERMAERLEAHFAESAAVVRAEKGGRHARRVADGGIAGVALAIVQSADERCAELPRDAAADLWALSVYCRMILGRWSGPQPRRSLEWLRRRACVRAAEVRR